MHRQGTEAVIICTGSKQGITNPPGNGAYNATKAAVKSMVEHVAWELRQQESHVTAHLLVPGWTFTGLTATADGRKPDGAWTADQVIEYLMQRIDVPPANKEFYIICPDNSVDTATDNARMLWNVNDIIEKRPALSRWSDAHKDEYEAFVREKVA
ncbi:protein of unknown function [Taphrina deformans PYCC 5710]|uniref:Uncharacterized protein n=1 Tax=Taphrina deformans (strain PYCC 5710 / ATCC 11124 / CBS 356.35 / IMI 108563 / JCM 9778 / NBRC 8474) TaxID=1097556 RepID=R4XPB9_TAPDE|nr:protein of unknown function [Taphrina deformans PYCC 5710]|eukprot:CCG85085.1 protein of unknown function [Taphrina deformans PYCC 5710]